MMSLRLSGDFLDIRIESKLNENDFKSFNNFMRSLDGAYYLGEDYKWMVPKKHLDDYVYRYEDKTAWHSTIEQIKGTEVPILPEFPLIKDFSDFKIMPYEFQQQGISFLAHVGSAILGDDMGLGKTLQTIGAAHILWKQGKIKKILVICPASLKFQWSKEIEKFLGHGNIVIDGTTKKKKEESFQQFITGDCLIGIINYELVRTMKDEMVKHHYDVIIADEAHRLKNRASQTYKAVAALSSDYRMASTGTPLQNNVEELYALFEWVKPGSLGNITAFKKKYMVYASKFGRRFVPIGSKRLGELRKIISPYMLRRLKKDVAKDLPPMIYHRRDVEMNPAQKKLYNHIEHDFLALLQQLSLNDVEGAFNSEGVWIEKKREKEDYILGFMYLMVATSDHPLLLSKGTGMSRDYKHLITEKIKSPKLQELVSIVEDRIDTGIKKIVIFTQFTSMQVLILEELEKLGKVEILNGSMSAIKRQEAMDNFETNSEIYFFVLTDAGNYGLNLQHANTLINYDSPWNPAVVEQRAGRVHRIGSTHDSVDIISLVTKGTIDERIQDTLEEKRKLSGSLIERNDSERSMMNDLIAQIKNKE